MNDLLVSNNAGISESLFSLLFSVTQVFKTQTRALSEELKFAQMDKLCDGV